MQSIKRAFGVRASANSEQQKLVAFENGVDDFVEKPFSNEKLPWRVKSLLRNVAPVVKLKSIMVAEPEGIIRETAQERFIDEVIGLIEAHLDKEYLNADFLAEHLFMSRATLYRRMEDMLGEAPSTFIKKYRLKKAAIYLKTGNYTLREVSAKNGVLQSQIFFKELQK